MRRCPWAGDDPAMRAYHDTEWGVPCHDDRRLFEFLILEGAQAGLSWATILNRRAGYARTFAGFDPRRVARFGEADRARLLADRGIVRNRAKVEAAIVNARAFLEVQAAEGSFAAFVWGFVDGHPIVNHWREPRQVPAETPLSRRLARELRRRGFRFVGPVICYAWMQSMGLVNDHLVWCDRHRALA